VIKRPNSINHIPDSTNDKMPYLEDQTITMDDRSIQNFKTIL